MLHKHTEELRTASILDAINDLRSDLDTLELSIDGEVIDPLNWEERLKCIDGAVEALRQAFAS